MAAQKRKNIDGVGIYTYDETSDSFVAASPNNPIPVISSSSRVYTTRYDESTASISYLGKALIGSSESDGVWMIQEMTDTNGDITIKFADGDSNFDNIWDDRATLSYL